jgi:hypothetical protein
MADSLPKGLDGKPIGHVLEFTYKVVDLPAWDFGDLTGGAVLRLALGMLHKMTGGTLDEYPKALLPLAEITDEEQRIELSKELVEFVAKAFQAHNRRVDKETLSKALRPVLKGKEKTMIKTIFEEREAIGEARGEAKARRSMVLAVLRAKFQKVPKEVERAVLAISDPIALESWAVQAATSASMDEFAEALR